MAEEGNTPPINTTRQVFGDGSEVHTMAGESGNQVLYNAMGQKLDASLGGKPMGIKLTPTGLEVLGSNGKVETFDRKSLGDIDITETTEVGKVIREIPLEPQILSTSQQHTRFAWWRLRFLVIELLCYSPFGTTSGGVYATYLPDPEMAWPDTPAESEAAALRLTSTRFIMARNGLQAIIPGTSDERYVKPAGTKRLERYGTIRLLAAAASAQGTSLKFKVFITAVIDWITPATQVPMIIKESTAMAVDFLEPKIRIFRMNSGPDYWMFIPLKKLVMLADNIKVYTRPYIIATVKYTYEINGCITNYREYINKGDFEIVTINDEGAHIQGIASVTSLSRRVTGCTAVTAEFTMPAVLTFRGQVAEPFAELENIEPSMLRYNRGEVHSVAEVVLEQQTCQTAYSGKEQQLLKAFRGFLGRAIPELECSLA